MKKVKITKVEEVPQLIIKYDNNEESPREWGNLGYFITKDSRQNSPDKNYELERIVAETGDEAENQEDHITRIKKAIAEGGEDEVIAIFPVVKYEHSGIVYRLGTAHGFDYSNNGFYIVTKNSLASFGSGIDSRDFEKHISAEIDLYNRWLNGEVYMWQLLDEKGEDQDGWHSGYYSLDDIKAELPAEWKEEDLTDYLQ